MSTGTLRLKKLQHTNGTDVATLDSTGAMNLSTIKSSTGNTAMTIDTSGNTTLSGNLIAPNRVAFRAWYTGGNISIGTSNTALVMNNVTQTGGTNFSTTTGKFTVPVTGFYSFSLKSNIYDVSSNNYARHGVLQNGTGFSTDEQLIMNFWTVGDGGDHTLNSSFMKQYTVGDTLQPFIMCEDGSYASIGENWQNFSGFLVG